jgi:hypothetical protein
MTIFALSRSTPALPLNTPHPRLPSPPSPGQTRRSSTTLSAASSGPACTPSHRLPRRRRRRQPAISARPPINPHPRTALRRSSSCAIAPKIQPRRGPSARPLSTHAKQRPRCPQRLGRRPRIACFLQQIRPVAPCGSHPGGARHASCLSVRARGQARVCRCNMT